MTPFVGISPVTSISTSFKSTFSEEDVELRWKAFGGSTPLPYTT